MARLQKYISLPLASTSEVVTEGARPHPVIRGERERERERERDSLDAFLDLLVIESTPTKWASVVCEFRA